MKIKTGIVTLSEILGEEIPDHAARNSTATTIKHLI
jgi:hypothetical protein